MILVSSWIVVNGIIYCASNLSVFIRASAITLVLKGLASFVCIPNCSNALYVFIHMLAVDSTTAVHLLPPYFSLICRAKFCDSNIVLSYFVSSIIRPSLICYTYYTILFSYVYRNIVTGISIATACIDYTTLIYSVVSIFNSPFLLILIVSNHIVTRLQTSIRARYAAHLYSSLYQQLPIQQTRPSLKEVTHNKGFECWTTIDYKNRLLHVYNKAGLPWKEGIVIKKQE